MKYLAPEDLVNLDDTVAATELVLSKLLIISVVHNRKIEGKVEIKGELILKNLFL